MESNKLAGSRQRAARKGPRAGEVPCCGPLAAIFRLDYPCIMGTGTMSGMVYFVRSSIEAVWCTYLYLRSNALLRHWRRESHLDTVTSNNPFARRRADVTAREI